MRKSQGLYVVPKSDTPNRPSTGLEPYLALERKRNSKPRATRDPELPLTVAILVLGALLAIAIIKLSGMPL